MFRLIVAATDFSPSADEAWRVTVELAKIHRAELLLLHVTMASARAPGVWQLDEGRQEQRGLAEHELQRRVAMASARTLTAKTLIETGDPPCVIAEVATRQAADLIVVGAHGRHAKGPLIGSVGERLLRLAPCAVLTVPRGGDR